LAGVVGGKIPLLPRGNNREPSQSLIGAWRLGGLGGQ